MKDLNLIIGNNIKYLRKTNKLTQSELAEKLNYSNKAVSRWESGEVIPDVVTLNNICNLFNIPISNIFEENIESKKIKKTHFHSIKIGNRLTISLLAVLLVWFIATISYVVLLGVYNKSFWQIFIIAVPLSCIVAIVFNSIWGKASTNFMLITTLIWSTIASIYLIFVELNLWFIFLIGIPLQIAVLLWANITNNIKNKKLQANLENSEFNN